MLQAIWAVFGKVQSTPHRTATGKPYHPREKPGPCRRIKYGRTACVVRHQWPRSSVDAAHLALSAPLMRFAPDTRLRVRTEAERFSASGRPPLALFHSDNHLSTCELCASVTKTKTVRDRIDSVAARNQDSVKSVQFFRSTKAAVACLLSGSEATTCPHTNTCALLCVSQMLNHGLFQSGFSSLQQQDKSQSLVDSEMGG